MKTKTATSTAEAFETIFKEGRIPNKIQTDDGKEFYNSIVNGLFTKHGIHLFSTNNETKASTAERFIRTLKEKLYRYFDTSQSFRYIDVLDKIVTNYNNTYHSTIKMTPNQVTKSNSAEVFHNIYGGFTEQIEPKLKVGDYVRISKAKHIFGKGYEGNWSIEVFIISEVQPIQPPQYKIVDLMKEEIEGRFYEPELQLVTKPTNFRIEKVIKYKTESRTRTALVKWLGYGDKFNSWIPVSDITDSKIVRKL